MVAESSQAPREGANRHLPQGRKIYAPGVRRNHMLLIRCGFLGARGDVQVSRGGHEFEAYERFPHDHNLFL